MLSLLNLVPADRQRPPAARQLAVRSVTRLDLRLPRLQATARLLNEPRDDIQREIVNLRTELPGIGFNRPARLSISRAFIPLSHDPLAPPACTARDLLSTREEPRAGGKKDTRREF